MDSTAPITNPTLLQIVTESAALPSKAGDTGAAAHAAAHLNIHGRRRVWIAMGATLFFPLIFSGMGFLHAHGRDSKLTAPGFTSVAATSAVFDGGSVCFEFRTSEAAPFWILLEKQGSRQTVLVSQTAGFEDYLQVKAGSAEEGRVLQWLGDLASRSGGDARVAANLQLLIHSITTPNQAWPSVKDWYLYENNNEPSGNPEPSIGNEPR